MEHRNTWKIMPRSLHVAEDSLFDEASEIEANGTPTESGTEAIVQGNDI